jgi:hypothetical protein
MLVALSGSIVNVFNAWSSMPHSRFIAQTSACLAIVFTAYVLAIALCFLHLRRWDSVILRQVVTLASYPLVFFGVVALGTQMTLKQGDPSQTSVWVLPLGSLLFMGLPFGVSQLGAWIVLPLAILGLVMTGYAFVRSHQNRALLRLLWLPWPGVIIALIYFAMINGSGYAHLFADVAAYTGTLHRDTLFHAAIVNMLAHFSTPSTGLDGVQPLAYHVGVHRWLAASQALAPGYTPMLLAIGMQIALLPVVFFAWSLAIALLLQRSINLLPLLGYAVGSWLVLGCFVWDSYLASESYAFSLPVFFAMAPVGQRWAEVGGHGKRALSFWALTIAVVAVVACTAAKISTGVVLGLFLTGCGLLPTFLQRDRGSQLLYGAAGLLFCITGVGLAYVAIGTPTLVLSPFHFAQTFPQIFVSANLLAILCIGAFYAWGGRGRTNTAPPGHRALTLALGLTFLASLVPGLLLDIAGGATYYFFHPALLLLLAFAIAGLINHWRCSSLDAHVALARSMTKSTVLTGASRFALAALAGVAITQLAIPLNNPVLRSREFVNYAAQTLSMFADDGPTVTRNIHDSSPKLTKTDKLNLLWAPPDIDLNQLPFSGLRLVEQQLAAAAVTPEAADTIVYISPDVSTFWMLEHNRTCWDKSFDVPGVLGLPLINGVRTGVNGCEVTPYYGMADYGSSSWNVEMSDAQLCQKALRLGFAQVLVIAEDERQLLGCQG